ncbi:hypothetical protein GPECTOR_4g611 [Gonium pectorale]|uniref:Uncharacterized protein n=1 Tax=Gonium pectorale TaxID=33097 RepID=A0A150GXB0_GONPE|nr:hypothetical protein GPECTOR_4g611 [Gonium pectorale]|eukprot:KXZ54546.1 hypothetical protein GPECTOR_4g611 [Gonium pectorale]
MMAAGGRAAPLLGLGGRGLGGHSGVPALVRTVWQDSKGYTHFRGRGSGWSLSEGGSRRALYVTGGLAAGFASYYVYCLEEVPYTGRRHSIMLVSRSGEQIMGKQLFEEVKAAAAAEGRLLPPSHPDVRRVERIGLAIAAVAGDGGGGGYVEHMKGLLWEFAVIDKNEPNAFVVPGGKVGLMGCRLGCAERVVDLRRTHAAWADGRGGGGAGGGGPTVEIEIFRTE